jgi:hypothetical protein
MPGCQREFLDHAAMIEERLGNPTIEDGFGR